MPQLPAALHGRHAYNDQADGRRVRYFFPARSAKRKGAHHPRTRIEADKRRRKEKKTANKLSNSNKTRKPSDKLRIVERTIVHVTPIPDRLDDKVRRARRCAWKAKHALLVFAPNAIKIRQNYSS